MLVRTKASQVEKIWTGFFDRYPAAEDLARDDLDTVSSSLGSLGLTWRSARIHRLGRAMVDDVDWTKALPKLPGCGPYVTAATKIGMTGRGILPVDVTIARVLTRYYGIEGRGEPRRQREVLNHAVALGQRSRRYFHAVLDLAAIVCTPTAPACSDCPLQLGCVHAAQTRRAASSDSASKISSSSS